MKPTFFYLRKLIEFFNRNFEYHVNLFCPKCQKKLRLLNQPDLYLKIDKLYTKSMNDITSTMLFLKSISLFWFKLNIEIKFL